jgi:hypothetical protein
MPSRLKRSRPTTRNGVMPNMLPERFWKHVVLDAATGCWLWVGATSKGYGVFKLSGRSRSAHGLAYEHLIGPVAEGFELDHLCRVRSCVNPAHLEPVTSSVNKLRSPLVGQGRRGDGVRCRNGHWLDVAGTTRRGYCVLCKRATNRRYKQRKKVTA